MACDHRTFFIAGCASGRRLDCSGDKQLLDARGGGEPSQRVATRVKVARDRQARRYADRADLHTNTDMVTIEDVECYTPLESSTETLFKDAICTLRLEQHQWCRDHLNCCYARC